MVWCIIHGIKAENLDVIFHQVKCNIPTPFLLSLHGELSYGRKLRLPGQQECRIIRVCKCQPPPGEVGGAKL